MATILDVSRRVGVSKSTVSKVLNGTGRVSEATKKAVFKAVKELDYRPNVLARSLSKQTTDTIGLIIPDAHNSSQYINNLIDMTQRLANKSGKFLMISQVDGNDILATHEAISNALNKAYTKNEPTVIEAITYRMCDHTTADDARRYRDDQELNDNKKKDPIIRLKNYLISQEFLDEEQDLEMQQATRDEVNKAVDSYSSNTSRDAGEIFNHLYETLPEAYLSQFEEAVEFSSATEGEK